MFARPAEEKGLRLAADLSRDFPPLLLQGDPQRLRQILVNLLSNAIKFTERGEVVLRVVMLELSAQRASIRLSVKTRYRHRAGGQAKVFEHFAQADGSTTRRFGGTGLGLAICKNLVELMAAESAWEANRSVVPASMSN